MKKISVFVLCTIMVLSTVACGSKITEKDVDVPDPFIDCETLENAEQLAGFEISLPEKMPEGFTLNAIRAIEKDLIEIDYINGDDKIYIRKAKGNEDISGDYNEYKENNTIEIGKLNVKMRGNDGMINVATWNDGDYSYAIGANNGEKGIDSNVVNDMVLNIQ